MVNIENGNRLFESEVLRKLDGVVLLSDADDFLIDGTRDLVIDHLRNKYRLTASECEVLKQYYYNMGKYPGWLGIDVDPAEVENEVRELYTAKGIHVALKVNEEMADAVRNFNKMGGVVLVHSSRRAQDREVCSILHEELVKTIMKHNLPISLIMTMADDISRHIIPPDYNSTKWKLEHGRQLKALYKVVIFGDDSYPVIQGAAREGFAAIVLAHPHNHPIVVGLETNSNTVELIPGMRRIQSQSHLVYAALSLVAEHQAHGGNIFPKIAAVEHLPVVG